MIKKAKGILDKLKKIQRVKKTVTERVWQQARPVKDLITGKILTAAAIKGGTNLLADRFIAENPNANPLLVSMMDGAMPFAMDFQTCLHKKGYSFTYSTMQASSYGNALSVGTIQIGSMPKPHLAGRRVFIVDDVCETAKTYRLVREKLIEHGASEVSLVVLVDKVQKRMDNYVPEYSVFKVAKNAFLVGMGMDYYRELRNETEIRGVKKSSLPNKQEKKLLDSEGPLNEQYCQLRALEKTSKAGNSHVTLFNTSNRPGKLRKTRASSVIEEGQEERRAMGIAG